jgi:hypothetical protein
VLHFSHNTYSNGITLLYKPLAKQMEAIRRQQMVKKSGEVLLRGLPVEAGQEIEVVILLLPRTAALMGQKRPQFTAEDLLQSGLVGLWETRTDITDSTTYARQLREQAQRRHYF